MSVAKAVEGGQIIDYAVTPLYRGAEAMPEAVQIIAKGNGGLTWRLRYLTDNIVGI